MQIHQMLNVEFQQIIRPKDLPFSQIFPTIDSLPASGLTPLLSDMGYK